MDTEYEQRLDRVITGNYEPTHPVAKDWFSLRYELSKLRKEIAELRTLCPQKSM